MTDVSQATIVANVDEWFELMTAYHEAVLGWVGGTKRIEGEEPSEDAVRDRLQIMRHAIDTIFGGRDSFNACWTYITADERRLTRPRGGVARLTGDASRA